MKAAKNSVKLVLILILSTIAHNLFAQQDYIQSLNQQNHWVDSVFKKLNRRKKIAQILFIRAHTNLGQAYIDSIAKVIKKEQIGGVVFFQGGPVRQANVLNQYQALAKIPLMVAMDGEWGLGMRLDSTISYPYQMALGAIQDNALIYKMGQYIAYDFKRLGMQMNFAPDMDVNNNPNNPVINYRSFGDNKYNVAKKGIAYMQGMQNGGLLSTAKHFPGHGDTDVDSHLDLPTLPFSIARLDSLEEYPFRQAVKAGISGVMVAHMNIPAMDSTKHLPSTLSRPIITGVLKDSLGFKGLIVSDAMGMKGVVKYFPDGEADVRAFIAGNDVLELSENSARAVKKIKKAIRKGKVSEQELDDKVKKVLAAKYWSGLNHYQPVQLDHLSEDLNRRAATALVQQLSDAAITLLKGDTTLQQLDFGKKTAIISIGATAPTVYQAGLAQWFTNNKLFMVGKDMPVDQMNHLLDTLKNFDQVIVGIHDTRLRPGSKLDYTSNVKLLIADLAAKPHSVISVFANPYTIEGLPGIEKAGALIAAYQKEAPLQLSAIQVITRRLKPTGKLPVSVNVYFPNGTGLTMP